MSNNTSRSQAFKFMDTLMLAMVDRRASDLFITAHFPPAAKIDGEITPLSHQVLDEDMTQNLVRSIMNDKQGAEFDRDKECNFATTNSKGQRFRVNAYIQQNKSAMVLRTIPENIPTLELLEMPPVLKDLALTKRGLIIFVGGTGTGKTTTLAALLNHRNENSKGHIITLEDPIEFIHKHKSCIVSQREVGMDTNTWESALKNSLRQAPDVILMGEIRDREAMGHAIDFSETGHLCLATLHANSANQALDRIINFFPEDRRQQLLMDLSLNLKAMVSQRLLPKKGVKGRVAAVEIMINTPLMSELILKGEIKDMKELMKKSTNLGMQTFDQALFQLHELEKITYEDAELNADSKNDFRLQVKLNSKIRREDPMANIGSLQIQEEPNVKRTF